MILRTLKETKGNIRATARRLSCSPNTVYLAKDEAKRKDLRDLPHTPKRRHPNHIEEKKEKMIMDYRKKTGLEKAPEASYLPKGRHCHPLRAMLGKSSGEAAFLNFRFCLLIYSLFKLG